MKRTYLYSALIALSISTLVACSSDNSSENTNQEAESSTSTAPQTTAAEPDTVSITLRAQGNTMSEMKFDQDEIKVPAGSIVKIELVNEGEESAMIHNAVIAFGGTLEATAEAANKAGADNNYVPTGSYIVAASPLASPGQTVEFIFEAPEPGDYIYVCTYPGHWRQMNGKLIVEN